MRLSGSVKDGTVLRAKSLDVRLPKDGAAPGVIFGECTLEVGEMPEKSATAGAATVTEKAERKGKKSKASEPAPPGGAAGEMTTLRPEGGLANGESERKRESVLPPA